MTQDQVDYLTCLIGTLALKTGHTCSYIYGKLQTAGLIKDYLNPVYDIMHTFSLDYAADDVIEIMKNKGVALC